MTQSDSKSARQRASTEAAEVVLMLPWYTAGTLSRHDRERVEAVLRQYPDLGAQVDKVREELAETILLNETLGAPPPQVAERLMAAIDAEPAPARRRRPGSAVNWLTGFFAGLSPRTMAVAASFAMLAIGLQSVLLVDLFTKPQGSASPDSLPKPESQVVMRGLGIESHGAFATVRFTRGANAGDITNFLQSYQMALVDGPTANGFYRVRVAVNSLPREDLLKVVQRLRREPVVELAEPAE
jgi:hypothetical protein